MVNRSAAKRSATKKAPAKKAPLKAKRRAAPSQKSTPAAAAGAKTRRGASSKKAKGGGTEASGADRSRVTVQNVNVPGYRTTVDARRYHAMKSTLLAVLPKGEPGLTQAEMFGAVRGKLPEDVFPGQEKAEWWVKCVHLDLEAKGEMKRTATKPLRWWRK